MWCIFPKLKDKHAPTRAFNKEMVLSLVYLLINNVAQGASRDDSPDSPSGGLIRIVDAGIITGKTGNHESEKGSFAMTTQDGGLPQNHCCNYTKTRFPQLRPLNM